MFKVFVCTRFAPFCRTEYCFLPYIFTIWCYLSAGENSVRVKGELSGLSINYGKVDDAAVIVTNGARTIPFLDSRVRVTCAGVVAYGNANDGS